MVSSRKKGKPEEKPKVEILTLQEGCSRIISDIRAKECAKELMEAILCKQSHRWRVKHQVLLYNLYIYHPHQGKRMGIVYPSWGRHPFTPYLHLFFGVDTRELMEKNDVPMFFPRASIKSQEEWLRGLPKWMQSHGVVIEKYQGKERVCIPWGGPFAEYQTLEEFLNGKYVRGPESYLAAYVIIKDAAMKHSCELLNCYGGVKFLKQHSLEDICIGKRGVLPQLQHVEELARAYDEIRKNLLLPWEQRRALLIKDEIYPGLGLPRYKRG